MLGIEPAGAAGPMNKYAHTALHVAVWPNRGQQAQRMRMAARGADVNIAGMGGCCAGVDLVCYALVSWRYEEYILHKNVKSLSYLIYLKEFLS